MTDEIFEIKKYADINKLAAKYSRVQKVVLASHENSAGRLSVKYILWEKEEDDGRYPGHGSGNWKWDDKEYFTSPIKNKPDLVKNLARNKGSGWHYQDTWNGWKGQRGNIGLKEYLTLEAGRCTYLYGFAILSPKKKSAGKKETARKGKLFLVKHAYGDQYERMYRVYSIMEYESRKGARAAVFEELTLPKNIMHKAVTLQFDEKTKTEWAKLPNGSILWADDREQVVYNEPIKSTLPVATPKSRVKMAKQLLKEGKLKPGHVTRLGIKKQTPPSPKSRAIDRKRSAMLPGYRVSENGNLYYEARENRSDTPLERRDKAYILSQRKLQRGTRLHDKYKPPSTPVIRKPKIISKVQKTSKSGADNRLLDVLEGHWFDFSSEYQLLEAKDGDCKGMFFAWERALPSASNLSSRLNFKSEWKLLYTEPIGKTLTEAISNFERMRSVKTRTGIRGALYTTTAFRMTAGMYSYIEKLHSNKKIAPVSNSKLISIMRKYERVIGQLRDHEENIAISEFGDVLYESYGGPHSCRLPPWIERFTKVDSHNHPGRDGWFGPSTFSIKTAYTNTSGGDIEAYKFWITRSLGEIRRTCSDGMAFTIFPEKLTSEMKRKLVSGINEKYGGARQSDAYKKASEKERYGIMCNIIREVFKKSLPKDVYYEEKL